ncbi:MAG: GNAT family N-acetyltransferase [bacterium]|nr:GNAT family N-acetyltransferase [bacterium]
MRFSIERVWPDQPERIARIRDYIIGYWRISPEKAEEYLGVSFGEGLPKAWVAILPDGNIIGHVILVVDPAGFCDVEEEPWLQALFVNEEWRSHKVGRDLVATVEDDCRRCGCRYLYLDTVDTEGYYLPLGWETIGTDFWKERGETVTIMRKPLD